MSDAALGKAGAPVVYIQLHLHSFQYPTLPCNASCDKQALELCLGKFAVCLSEGPQRVRKESPVTAECSTCSRQCGYIWVLGLGLHMWHFFGRVSLNACRV